MSLKADNIRRFYGVTVADLSDAHVKNTVWQFLNNNSPSAWRRIKICRVGFATLFMVEVSSESYLAMTLAHDNINELLNAHLGEGHRRLWLEEDCIVIQSSVFSSPIRVSPSIFEDQSYVF